MSLVLSGDSPSFSGTYQGGTITSGTAQATTSGTAIDFTGIPSWVKRITVMLNGVSTNGSSIPQLQIGTSGGIQSTSYLGSVSALGNSTGVTSNLSSGFALSTSTNWGATNTMNGSLTLSLLDAGSGIWVCSGVLGWTGLTVTIFLGGTKTLSGTLDRIRLTTVNGTDTFDAGSVNILYEG